MRMLRGHLMLPVQCSAWHWMAQLKVAMILMWEVLVLFTSRWKNRWGTCGNLIIVMWMTWARCIILWKIKGYLIYGSLRLSLIMDTTHCRYPGDKADRHCRITGIWRNAAYKVKSKDWIKRVCWMCTMTMLSRWLITAMQSVYLILISCWMMVQSGIFPIIMSLVSQNLGRYVLYLTVLPNIMTSV